MRRGTWGSRDQGTCKVVGVGRIRSFDGVARAASKLPGGLDEVVVAQASELSDCTGQHAWKPAVSVLVRLLLTNDVPLWTTLPAGSVVEGSSAQIDKAS